MSYPANKLLIARISLLGAILCAMPVQALTGDLDCNGKVDFSDFFIFSDNFNTTSSTTPLVGDFDGNGKVDFSDFFILSDNFGKQEAVGPECGTAGTTDTSGVVNASDFYTPQVLGEILAATRTITWATYTGSISDRTRVS